MRDFGCLLDGWGLGCLGVLWKRVVLLFSGYIFIVKLLITSDEKNNYFFHIKYISLVTGS